MLPSDNPNFSEVGKEVLKATGEVVNEAQRLVDVTASHFERSIGPLRKSIIKRFPVLFLLAVTFGVTATVTGIEQILIQYDVFQRHPIAILAISVGILVVTGKIYKKLG